MAWLMLSLCSQLLRGNPSVFRAFFKKYFFIKMAQEPFGDTLLRDFPYRIVQRVHDMHENNDLDRLIDALVQLYDPGESPAQLEIQR